jgi:putative phage-type endonuclease
VNVDVAPHRNAFVTNAVPVTDWDASDEEWLEDRRSGVGGSDVLSLLGFSQYRSPWEVWREKTGRAPIEMASPSAAADLGNALEPWLIEQAESLIGVPAFRTATRTYGHADFPWRRCSPDGVTADGRLVEAKTAGLASGFGTPKGWADGAVPLGYEFQVRWGLHVMDAPAAEVIALVSGLGLIRRTVERDLKVESKMVAQVEAWWQRHVIEGVEPDLSGADAAVIAELYPRTVRESVDLDDTDALEHWEIYLAARERAQEAEAEQERAGAELKALIGDAKIARVGGNVIATWPEVKGKVNHSRLLAELTPALEKAGITVPNPEDYRGVPTRRLNVKEL